MSVLAYPWGAKIVLESRCNFQNAHKEQEYKNIHLGVYSPYL